MLGINKIELKISIMADVLAIMLLTLLLQLSAQFWSLSNKQTTLSDVLSVDWFSLGAIATLCAAFYVTYWFINVSDRTSRMKAWYLVSCVLSVPALFIILN